MSWKTIHFTSKINRAACLHSAWIVFETKGKLPISNRSKSQWENCRTCFGLHKWVKPICDTAVLKTKVEIQWGTIYRGESNAFMYHRVLVLHIYYDLPPGYSQPSSSDRAIAFPSRPRTFRIKGKGTGAIMAMAVWYQLGQGEISSLTTEVAHLF